MPAILRLAIGGGSPEVHVVSFSDGKKLETISAVEATHASWIVPHPTVSGVFFATGELEEGTVRVIIFEESGKAQVVTEQSSAGMHPTHLAVSTDGTELLVANYSAGGVTILPILPAAPFLGPHSPSSPTIEFLYTPAAPTEPLAHSGFNPERQEASHPHQVLVLPAPHDEVLVPDLGSDKVWRLARSDGEWTVIGYLAFPRGSGPRHAAFVDGVLYTVLELSSELAAHKFPPFPEEPTHIATLSTLNAAPTHSSAATVHPGSVVYADHAPPEQRLTEPIPAVEPAPTPANEDEENPQLAAEILTPPPLKEDGASRFIYVSNRNERSALGDSIAVFSAVPAFSLLRRVTTGVKHLRGLAFSPLVDGIDGQYLALAGQIAGGVKVFERRPGGILEDIPEATLDLQNKSSFVWL